MGSVSWWWGAIPKLCQNLVMKPATKTELAGIVGLTTRQITNLVDEGMPREVDGNKVFFDIPTAVQWYIKKIKEGAKAGDDESKKLGTRRLELEVAMSEIELATLQGGTVTLDYMESQFSAVLERLRAACLNAPGKYAPSMTGLRTIAEAQTRLEALSTDLIAALSEVADDPELDDEPAEAA